MSKQVPTAYRKAGNLPATRVSFYSDAKLKPTITVDAGWMVHYLTYKTETNKDTKETKLRDKMAVACRRIERSQVSGECIQQMINDHQEKLLKRCADGELAIEQCESGDFLSSDYLEGSERMKEEDVTKFFTANVSDWLNGKVAEKYPKWEEEKVSALVSQYAKLFGELTNKFLPQSHASAKNMVKVWADFCNEVECEDERMLDYVTARLAKLIDKHEKVEDVVEAI